MFGRFKVTTYWPLLIVIAALAFAVWRIAPANLTVIPYKLLLIAVSIYVAHLVDAVFEIDEDLPRAVVFAGVVLGLTLGL